MMDEGMWLDRGATHIHAKTGQVYKVDTRVWRWSLDEWATSQVKQDSLMPINIFNLRRIVKAEKQAVWVKKANRQYKERHDTGTGKTRGESGDCSGNEDISKDKENKPSHPGQDWRQSPWYGNANGTTKAR